MDRKIKVGVFAQQEMSGAGGAATFGATLVAELETLSKHYNVVVLYQGVEIASIPNGIECINISEYKKKHYLSLLLRNFKNRIRDKKLFWRFHAPFLIPVSYMDDIANEYGIDIFWFTRPADFYLTTPYICTIWDLGHKTLPIVPETSKPIGEWIQREAFNENMISRASYVITGNETGKKEILENYRIPSNRIRVVPFEVSSFCKGDAFPPKDELPGNFFLYPAQFWPHKNHIRILKALKLLREKYNLKPCFVFTGSDKGNREYIEKMINEYDLADQVKILGFVQDEELKWLYQNANALVFASMMGPNNLPPIEAIFLGCPVIISNIEGHQEQMGDAALYFDPLSEDDLSDVIYNFISKPELLEQLYSSMEHMREEISRYQYIDRIVDILDEFSTCRELWG